MNIVKTEQQTACENSDCEIILTSNIIERNIYLYVSCSKHYKLDVFALYNPEKFCFPILKLQ